MPHGYEEIGRAYYERATEDEKEEVKKVFRKLDVDDDGKISCREVKKYFESWISNDRCKEVYKKLDKDGDGMMDFSQFLPVYYMKFITGSTQCSSCFASLLGPFFSCLLCLGKFPSSYNLCCACHHKGKSKHEHESKHMIDNYHMIHELKRRTAAAEWSHKKKLKKTSSQGGIRSFMNVIQSSKLQPEAESMRHANQVENLAAVEMAELVMIAKAHYESASDDVQKLARDFFNSMDTDGNGKVDVEEFLTFMTKDQQRHVQMCSRHFFKEVDTENKGSLGFWDVMTVFYIIKSGRPFCTRCGDFIPGLYFSCVVCYKSTDKGSYHLCCECYRSKKCNHKHNGSKHFLDNYTLLEATRDSALGEATGVVDQNKGKALMTSYNKAKISELPNEVLESPSNYPIIPFKPSLRKTESILRTFQALLNIAMNVGCTIM